MGAESSQRRIDILSSTANLIARNGIAGVRLQDVAAETGISVGTIQHYFRTREALIDEALREHTMATVRSIWRGSAASDDPWIDLLELLRRYRRAGDFTQRARIWIALSSSALTNVEHRSLLQWLDREWRLPFRENLQRGISSGRYNPDLDLEQCVEVIMRLTDGYAVDRVVYPEGQNEEAVLRAMRAVLVGLLRSVDTVD